MSAGVELRLIGSPEEVAATVEWLQAHGLAIERDRQWPSRKTKGDICRYLEVVAPGSQPKTAAA